MAAKVAQARTVRALAVCAAAAVAANPKQAASAMRLQNLLRRLLRLQSDERGCTKEGLVCVVWFMWVA